MALRPSARPRLEILECRQLLAIFTVTNTGDSGGGSLRQAILNANVSSGASRILFEIPPPPLAPGARPIVTIEPKSALPVVRSNVVIDATTQPGYSASAGPVVVLDGAEGSAEEGLVIGGNSAGLIGLKVTGFGGDEVLVTGQQDLIESDWLGGGVREGNSFNGQPKAGLSLIGSVGSTIIDDVLASNQIGIFVGRGSSRDVFQSNFSQYNDYGLYSIDATLNTIGSTSGNNTGNQFTNDAISGIVLVDTSPAGQAKPEGNTIAGNVIAADGVLVSNGVVPRGVYGAVTLISAGGNIIGGASATAGNHIVDNFADGLTIEDNGSPGASHAIAAGNLIQGNLIGGTSPGTTVGGPGGPPYGNSGNAIVLAAKSSNTTILANNLSYNGGAATVDNGLNDSFTGNTETNDEQRQVDFGVAVGAIPATGPYAVGATVEVDFTVFNQGPGYAEDASLALNFSGAPGLKLASTSGGSNFGILEPNSTTVQVSITSPDGSGTSSSTSGPRWAPGTEATFKVFFTVTAAGSESIQAIVGSGGGFDDDPYDKVDVLKLSTVQ